jgi:hypothetical protein
MQDLKNFILILLGGISVCCIIIVIGMATRFDDGVYKSRNDCGLLDSTLNKISRLPLENIDSRFDFMIVPVKMNDSVNINFDFNYNQTSIEICYTKKINTIIGNWNINGNKLPAIIIHGEEIIKTIIIKDWYHVHNVLSMLKTIHERKQEKIDLQVAKLKAETDSLENIVNNVKCDEANKIINILGK